MDEEQYEGIIKALGNIVNAINNKQIIKQILPRPINYSPKLEQIEKKIDGLSNK